MYVEVEEGRESEREDCKLTSEKMGRISIDESWKRRTEKLSVVNWGWIKVL